MNLGTMLLFAALVAQSGQSGGQQCVVQWQDAKGQTQVGAPMPCSAAAQWVLDVNKRLPDLHASSILLTKPTRQNKRRAPKARAAGLSIGLTREFFRNARAEAAAEPGVEYADIWVTIDGKQYKYSLEQFLLKLGIPQK